MGSRKYSPDWFNSLPVCIKFVPCWCLQSGWALTARALPIEGSGILELVLEFLFSIDVCLSYINQVHHYKTDCSSFWWIAPGGTESCLNMANNGVVLVSTSLHNPTNAHLKRQHRDPFAAADLCLSLRFQVYGCPLVARGCVTAAVRGRRVAPRCKIQ